MRTPNSAPAGRNTADFARAGVKRMFVPRGKARTAVVIGAVLLAVVGTASAVAYTTLQPRISQMPVEAAIQKAGRAPYWAAMRFDEKFGDSIDAFARSVGRLERRLADNEAHPERAVDPAPEIEDFTARIRAAVAKAFGPVSPAQHHDSDRHEPNVTQSNSDRLRRESELVATGVRRAAASLLNRLAEAVEDPSARYRQRRDLAR